MKSWWKVSVVLGGLLLAGCSQEAADAVTDGEPEADVAAEVTEKPADESVNLSPEAFLERYPEAESVTLAELAEVESIAMRGPMLSTYTASRMISHELVLEDEGAIRRILEVIQEAELGEVAAEDIGPSLLLVVEGGGQFSGPYAFFFNERYEAFELPDDTGNRYYLTEEDANAMKELIFSALEEKIGETAGVGVFAAPAFIPPGENELSLTVINDRAAAFEAGKVRFKKRTEELEWAAYPAEGNVLETESLSCPAFEECEWTLDLSAVTDEWPVGEYAVEIGDLVAGFHVE
ncbi:hypothetical protein [Indiicoccus explosivorum]|uniref:hypothetical protein n=1 Tax=Indiicoccus explosivorum TaxID=1917864 RepID=UPI000B452B84|nr:hypothetical protein [Indiicoccus explosivorum]